MTSSLFRSIEDYELFLYTLTEQYPSIARSTLALVRIGTSMARVSGEVYFHNGIHLSMRERLLFDRLPLIIDAYGYEIWRGKDKLFWYDSQPHQCHAEPFDPGPTAPSVTPHRTTVRGRCGVPAGVEPGRTPPRTPFFGSLLQWKDLSLAWYE